MVQITSVRMVGGVGHEHIGSLRWVNPDTHAIGESTREAIVDWLRKSQNNVAAVWDGTRWVRIGIVDAHPTHVRTYADGKWTDNLLALPRY